MGIDFALLLIMSAFQGCGGVREMPQGVNCASSVGEVSGA